MLFAGVSSAVGAVLQVYGETSIAMHVLEEFGLAPSPALKTVAAQGGARVNGADHSVILWPQSRSSELAAQIFIASAEQSELTAIRSRGVLADVPATKSNSLYYVAGSESLSLRTGSPLGVAWAGHNVVPNSPRWPTTRGTGPDRRTTGEPGKAEPAAGEPGQPATRRR